LTCTNIYKEFKKNPNTTLGVLETFAASRKNSNAKYDMARDQDTPESVLRILADDDGKHVTPDGWGDSVDISIKHAVAANPNTPVDVLWRMVDMVLSQGQHWREVFEALCHNSNTPPQAYRKMYKAGDASRRERLKKLGIAKWWWF
jgi:hypothetical protein